MSVTVAQLDILHIQVINAESVNVWNKDRDRLELEIKNLSYPPSFQIVALTSSQQVTSSTVVKISFIICDDVSNTFNMNIPLNCNLMSPPTGNLFYT